MRPYCQAGLADCAPVAETIALYLRDVDAPRPYLYTQIFAGLSYVVASGFMIELWQVLRRRHARDRLA